MAAMSYQFSSRFLLKSSSTIFKSCPSRSPSTAATHAPSNTTIRSSRSSASRRRIFSKPTSSTALPLMRISSAVALTSSALAEAYFSLNASKKPAGGSLGLEGRTKDAAVEEAPRPARPITNEFDHKQSSTFCRTQRQLGGRFETQKTDAAGIFLWFRTYNRNTLHPCDFHRACLYWARPIRPRARSLSCPRRGQRSALYTVLR